MMAASQTIFGRLPAGTFRIFAGSSRGFFAELLEYLDAEVFGIPGELVTRHAGIAAIAEFIARNAQDLAFDEEDGDAAALSSEERRDPDPRKYVAFRRLLDTGWLVERKDRYRRIVDFDPDARLLLQALLEIKSGRLRSYGGEVLQVQALLDSARQDPDRRSENIANAARAARGFQNHLRSVSGAMHKIEDALVQQNDLASLFGTYFDDFVAEQLIVDYKRLHTQDNPFRFRTDIIDLAQDMAGDRLLLEQFADAVVREGRARDRDAATALVGEDLQQVIRVFEAVDDHLDLINATQSRIERRVRNTVRYMDRIGAVRTHRLAAALQALGATGGAIGLDMDAAVSAAHRFLPFAPAIGQEHLYQPARRRGEPERKALTQRTRDPAVEAFQSDLIAYHRMARVTPEKMRAYIERAMAGRDAIDARELPVETLEDFFVFERLRELPYLADGRLRQHYRMVFTGGRLRNDWIDCPDFRIHRASQGASQGASAA